MSCQRRTRTFLLSLTLLTALLATGCFGPFKREPTPEPVVLRFAYSGAGQKTETALEIFHKDHPHIQVEVIDPKGVGRNLAYLVRSGDVDIFRTTREAIEYVDNDLIMPLTDLLGDEWVQISDDYYEGVWEALNVDGLQYGIPAGLDLFVGYINTDALATLGIDYPSADWTLFDFLDMINKLNHPDGIPGQRSTKMVGCCTTYYDIDPVIFIYLYGGKIVDDLQHPTTPTLDDPQTIEAIRWYSDLFNHYEVAPDPSVLQLTFSGGIREAVANGYCGTWLGWYSDRGSADSDHPWAIGWRMMPLPKNDSTFELGDVDGYYVTSSCEHPKEALMLLRFMADRLDVVGAKLPPRRSLVNSEAYERAVGSDVVAVANRFSRQVIMIPYAESNVLMRIGAVLIEAIANIIQKDLDAANVLQEAQRRSLRILD